MRILKGTYDLLPPDTEKWQYLESFLREVFRLRGYREIRTPLIEELRLFSRSVGETTDIIQKEMYSFKDRGGREICLRPEETAPVVRSYIENRLYLRDKPARLYYLGPMFRAERPQKGRMRQFSQAGVEAIGATSVFLDAEVIQLLVDILEGLGLKKYQLRLNNLGCRKDRQLYSGRLRKLLEKQIGLFCADCQRRFTKNILRIFDCKEEKCRLRVKKLPAIGEKTCNRCQDYFANLTSLLDKLEIPYTLDKRLVRGLDYYTSTAFEVTCPTLGAQDAIAAGGRYDNLVADLGGPPTGAIGFALGLERVMLAAEKEGIGFPAAGGLEVYLIPLAPEGIDLVLRLMKELREEEISVQSGFGEGRSLKAQLRSANKLGVPLVGILGEDELREGKITLKDMATGKQKKVLLKKFVVEVKKEIGN